MAARPMNVVHFDVDGKAEPSGDQTLIAVSLRHDAHHQYNHACKVLLLFDCLNVSVLNYKQSISERGTKQTFVCCSIGSADGRIR